MKTVKSRFNFFCGKLLHGFQFYILLDRNSAKWYFSMCFYKYYFELHLFDKPREFIKEL